MGIDPMDPMREADNGTDNLLRSNIDDLIEDSVQAVDIVVGNRKFGKVHAQGSLERTLL
jgi:hypothetical protein